MPLLSNLLQSWELYGINSLGYELCGFDGYVVARWFRYLYANKMPWYDSRSDLVLFPHPERCTHDVITRALPSFLLLSVLPHVAPHWATPSAGWSYDSQIVLDAGAAVGLHLYIVHLKRLRSLTTSSPISQLFQQSLTIGSKAMYRDGCTARLKEEYCYHRDKVWYGAVIVSTSCRPFPRDLGFALLYGGWILILFTLDVGDDLRDIDC